MMPYMVGFCPCCEAQIMVKDAMGRWCSYKPNYRQADIFFKNGAPVRTIICSDCLENNPNLTELVNSITNVGSQATTEKGKEIIKTYGEPVRIVPWTM